MASTPRSKRTDTNWLRSEIVSEFHNLSDVLNTKLIEVENSRVKLQESFENVKTEVGAIKQELMADLQRLHDETIRMADSLRQKNEETIGSYRDDLELRIKRYDQTWCSNNGINLPFIIIDGFVPSKVFNI